MEIMCDILDRVARKGLTEKMTFESRPAEDDEAKPCGYLEKEHSYRDTTGSEALRWKWTLYVGETGCSAS